MFVFKLQNQSRVKGNSIFLVLGALPAPSPPHLGKSVLLGRTCKLSKLSWEGILRAVLGLGSGFCGLGGGYHDPLEMEIVRSYHSSFGFYREIIQIR